MAHTQKNSSFSEETAIFVNSCVYESSKKKTPSNAIVLYSIVLIGLLIEIF